MKKSVLFIGLFAVTVAFAACCGKNAKSGEGECDSTKIAACDSVKAEFAAKWANFDSLSVEEQGDLIAKRVECFTKCREACAAKKAECEAKKAEGEVKEEVCEAKQAIEAEWANFENLTLAEKKAFFDKVDSLKPAKKCCKAEGEKKCCKEKAEGEKKCCKDKKAE
ncbi:MAG: hypothetical protein LBN95_09015 [Prevotellaceae bacterium]|jgi:hypothetical protein|nr:hypothetical protein [Prevotellaceae bacterium]